MEIEINDLLPIFREVLENNQLEIKLETTAEDVGEWDSLSHIYLVVAIEKKFKKKFTTLQIQSWKCVGDILSDLNRK